MKKSLIFALILVFISTLGMFLISCNSPVGGGVGTYTVRYEISGPQAVANRIAYTNETSNLDQITNFPIPWEKTITLQSHQGRNTVSFSVIILNNTSTYTAKIFVNGKEIATADSSSISIAVSGVIQ